MEQFYQKILFTKKKFSFKENGIDIDLKDNDGDFSLFIHFDRILSRNNIRISTKKRKRVLQIGLLFAGLTFLRGITAINSDINAMFAAIATSLIIAGIVYLYYYLTTVKYYSIPLEDNKVFQVFFNKPSKEEASAFIDEIYERRKTYYRDNYFFIDYENEKKKELSRMNWLLSENIISENEYNVVVDEINENIDQ